MWCDPGACVVFIGHSFAPRCNSYSLRVFRETMRSVERDVNAASAMSGGRRVAFFTELGDKQPSLRPTLFRLLAETRLGVVDISDNNPNVLFELGHLAARGVPLMVLKSQESLLAGYKIPVYVDPDDVEHYADIGQVKGVVTRWLRAQTRVAKSTGVGALAAAAL